MARIWTNVPYEGNAAEPEFRTQYELVDPALLPLRTFGTKVSRDRKHYSTWQLADLAAMSVESSPQRAAA